MMDEKEFKFSNLPPLPDTRGIDLDRISPIYGKPSQKSKSPEYIPYNRRGRDLYGRLTINTGYFWLGGFVGGGMYGIQEGWRNAASPNAKIRLNSVLNAASRRGAHLASSLGIIGMMVKFLYCWVMKVYLFPIRSIHAYSWCVISRLS